MLNLVAKKIGMTHKYNESNILVPVTMVQFLDNVIIDRVEFGEHDVVQVAFGKSSKVKNISNSVKGFFAKKSLPVFSKIRTSKIRKDSIISQGSSIDMFEFIKEGDKLDVSGVSIGKGFAGAMKRWNFRGLEASHGVSVSHRSHGSTGQRQDPGKVFKGKKMAGHLGCEKVTTKNLEVVFVDREQLLIGLKGSVPGNSGGSLIVKIKKYL